MGRSDPLCPVEHAIARFALISDKNKSQILFDADHKLPLDYVPKAVEWMKKHL
jgi:hypothetical protein